jgi:hypothetical protein
MFPSGTDTASWKGGRLDGDAFVVYVIQTSASSFVGELRSLLIQNAVRLCQRTFGCIRHGRGFLPMERPFLARFSVQPH